MPGAQAVRRTVESSSKIFDCVDVGTCGVLSVITTLEFFQHHFSQMGHRDLLVTQPYLTRQATNAPLPHAQRPPPGGYVQTVYMDKSYSCHVLINALSEPGPQFRFTLQERVNVVAAGSGLRAILARPFEARCSRMR